MALKKELESLNGVVLDYHRISKIEINTNENIIIEIRSYVNENKRLLEEKYIELQNKMSNGTIIEKEIEMLNNRKNIYYETFEISISYEEDMSIVDAYEYLKTLDEFIDAEDI